MTLRPSVLLSHVRGRHVWTLAAVVLLGYFLWHGVNGHYGLLAWRDYRLELEAKRTELADLRQQREDLAARVTGLRGPIDPDLLDEQAHRSLSLVGPLDVIILLEDQEHPAVPEAD